MKKKLLFDLLVLFLLGLLPLLWFQQGTVILGHDSGLPINPLTHFLDRLYMWSQRFSLGTDQSPFLIGAFFIHGIEAFLSLFGFSLQVQQKIQFIFWFLMPGLSMYFVARKLFSHKEYLPLIASVIYMINFYLIQGWFIAERTKFSLYTAIPIVFFFAFSYLTKKYSFWPSVIFTGITLSIFNGGGSFPLYGGLIVILLITFVFVNFVNFSFDSIRRTIFYSLGVLLIYIFLNSYWLVPYFYYVISNYGRDLANAGGAEGVLTWASYLAKGSSFINLLRGQGIPEWYLNEFHPYAKYFFSNPLLIFYSYLIPILTVLSFIIVKKAKDKFLLYLFLAVLITGIILSAGPISQFGFIFEFLVRYVPGFPMFRSAYFKFGYAIWFAFSFIVAFSVDYLVTKYIPEKRKIFTIPASYIAVLVFITSYLFFHYPVINGLFFDYSNNPQGTLTTRVKIPTYVNDFNNWIHTKHPDDRFLIMPELDESSYISYTWGYWSLAPLNSLFAKNSFVHNTSLMPGNEKIIINEMYKAFLQKDIEGFSDYIDLFAIDYIVLQKDIDWKNPNWGTTDPQKYEEILKSNNKFVLERQFGEWSVYKIGDKDKRNRVTVSKKINYSQVDISNLVSFPFYNPEIPMYTSSFSTGKDKEFAEIAENIFVGASCANCTIDQTDYGYEVYNPKILPGSFLYFLVEDREKKLRDASTDFASQTNFLLTTADKRIVETKWMVEFRQNTTFIQKTLTRYRNLLTELNTLIENSNNWQVDANNRDTIAKTIRAHLLIQSSLIESIHNDAAMTLENRLMLASAYEQVTSIFQKISSKIGTERFNEKKYIVNIPKNHEYGIYVKKSSVSNPEADLSSFSVSLDKINSTFSPISETEGWLFLGSTEIPSGNVEILLEDPTITNLGLNIVPIASDSSGITYSNGSFTMNAGSENKCISFPVSELDTENNVIYKVSFEYRTFTDEKIVSFNIEDNQRFISSLRSKEALLPVSRQWTTFTSTFSPDNESKVFNFCNGFTPLNRLYSEEPFLDNLTTRHGDIEVNNSSGVQTDHREAEIRNLSIYKISTPIVVLHGRNVIEQSNETVLDYKKISPVEYEINNPITEESLFITLKESFANLWVVCSNEICTNSNNQNHFASAGFSNTWYFKDGLDSKVTIKYEVQKRFELGVFITIVSWVLVVIWIIYSLRNRFIKRKI